MMYSFSSIFQLPVFQNFQNVPNQPLYQQIPNQEFFREAAGFPPQPVIQYVPIFLQQEDPNQLSRQISASAGAHLGPFG